jgi:carboxypeptidase C (cathepsin A)
MANVLYIESPAGVGYSLAGNVQDTIHNDMSTSVDAVAALYQWYLKFPEFVDNELYISGESYGGIYVPYLGW